MKANLALATMMIISTGLSSCGDSIVRQSPESSLEQGSKQFGVADVGRNAAIALMSDLEVQDLVRKGKNEKALRLLDSSYLLQVALLREFDQDLNNDERHVRLRNKAVAKLKRMWLDNPPDYLDERSASFIETICLRVPDCPPGKLVSKKPLPDLPRK